ncbi:MAG TPA: hypothetical protein VMA75_04790 [Candidatus Paceibacterota bacterium]|nr:hypothetical protein [Candidatus Paceibacterota bacterium]
MDLKKLMTTAPPPPPSQVKIRTMRSDIDAMMRSGGGAPVFQNVPVSGLTLEKEYKPPTAFHTPAPMATAAPAPASAPAVAAAGDESGVATSAGVAPAPSRFVPETEPSSHSNLLPIIVVTIVAIVAIAVVGYFAYILFK